MSNYFTWSAGRTRQGSPTLESQPGAHTGDTRQYIPGYSDSNIVYLDTASGNDANSGATELLPKLTQSAAETAAGSTKKIRVINDGAELGSVAKPTEMKRGLNGSIAADYDTSLDSWSSAGTPSFGTSAIYDVQYSDLIDKFVAAGAAGKIGYSTDGSTWTQAGTPSFSTDAIYSIAESDDILVAVGDSGKIATSTDGDVWTQRTSTTTEQLLRVHYNRKLETFAATGQKSVLLLSDDGVTWRSAGFRSAVMVGNVGSNAPALCSHPETGVFVLGDSVGRFSYSYDGENWYDVGNTPSNAIVSIVYNSLVGEFLALCNGANGWRSSDGITWTATTTDRGGNELAYIPDIGIYLIASQSSNIISWGTNGNTWTTATTPVISSAYGVAVNPSALCVMVGNTGVIVYKQIALRTIQADIAGFTIYGASYTGTRTLYNCTLRRPVTTAALSLNACRLTESGAHISNNAATLYQTLVEGDIHYTGTYAAANALDINLNTIAGTLYIYNGSETHYERIRDNIIEGGVQASYPVTVTSGNTRGTSSNGVIFGALHTTSDPLFVDETDYKLKRVLDGYQYDSPMVAASQYYYNQATTQTFRDNGAWSYNEGSATYKYQRTFDFLMPATAIGSAIDFVRHNRANLHVAEDGTPDAVNTPDSRWEEIVMQFKTLPADHIDFINWLEGQVDMTCDISLSPSLTPTTAVTASGATAAGEAVITITDNSGLDSGDQLTIDGNTYTVLYTYGTTKVVLDRITTTALSDTESITVKYDTGFGEYQYVPMLERRLSRWYETDENYMRGLQIRFARKLP